MKQIMEQVLRECIEEVHARKLLAQALEKEGLSKTQDYYLIAIGKAACAMAEAAHDYFGNRIIEGLVITRIGYARPVVEYDVRQAEHPIPGPHSIIAGEAVLELVQNRKKGVEFLLLISGGASALAVSLRDGITLDDLRGITEALQQGGADIVELNSVRKHLSKIKGGQLAELVKPAQIHGFLLSDVIGNRLDTIGSGPAVPDQTTTDNAVKNLEKYTQDRFAHVKDAMQKETPNTVTNATHKVIGDNELFCHLAAEKMRAEGIFPIILTTEMRGEARVFAGKIPEIVKSLRQLKGIIQFPCVAICGGETTVTVKNPDGIGGRNQELALAAAIAIRKMKGVSVAACASDGADGRSDNAGAIVDWESYDKMISIDIDPEDYLNANNSTLALDEIKAAIKTGPSNTNVNDILMIRIEE
ncbi:MAG: DUF4147 domain-containing protein [Candidatus Cloacimonetes bacterium]|nr:DUF4147 domain-containing protein [Candidatus Cloacimonadota bacterium]